MQSMVLEQTCDRQPWSEHFRGMCTSVYRLSEACCHHATSSTMNAHEGHCRFLNGVTCPSISSLLLPLPILVVEHPRARPAFHRRISIDLPKAVAVDAEVLFGNDEVVCVLSCASPVTSILYDGNRFGLAARDPIGDF